MVTLHPILLDVLSNHGEQLLAREIDAIDGHGRFLHPVILDRGLLVQATDTSHLTLLPYRHLKEIVDWHQKKAAVRLHAGLKVLDIGCSDASLGCWLGSMGVEYLGIDRCPKAQERFAAQVAEQTFTAAKPPSFVRLDVDEEDGLEKLKDQIHCFDPHLIVVSATLEHLRRPEALLEVLSSRYACDIHFAVLVLTLSPEFHKSPATRPMPPAGYEGFRPVYFRHAEEHKDEPAWALFRQREDWDEAIRDAGFNALDSTTIHDWIDWPSNPSLSTSGAAEEWLAHNYRYGGAIFDIWLLCPPRRREVGLHAAIDGLQARIDDPQAPRKASVELSASLAALAMQSPEDVRAFAYDPGRLVLAPIGTGGRLFLVVEGKLILETASGLVEYFDAGAVFGDLELKLGRTRPGSYSAPVFCSPTACTVVEFREHLLIRTFNAAKTATAPVALMAHLLRQLTGRSQRFLLLPGKLLELKHNLLKDKKSRSYLPFSPKHKKTQRHYADWVLKGCKDGILEQQLFTSPFKYIPRVASLILYASLLDALKYKTPPDQELSPIVVHITDFVESMQYMSRAKGRGDGQEVMAALRLLVCCGVIDAAASPDVLANGETSDIATKNMFDRFWLHIRSLRHSLKGHPDIPAPPNKETILERSKRIRIVFGLPLEQARPEKADASHVIVHVRNLHMLRRLAMESPNVIKAILATRLGLAPSKLNNDLITESYFDTEVEPGNSAAVSLNLATSSRTGNFARRLYSFFRGRVEHLPELTAADITSCDLKSIHMVH
jgi:hypothetical protein